MAAPYHPDFGWERGPVAAELDEELRADDMDLVAELAAAFEKAITVDHLDGDELDLIDQILNRGGY